MPVWSTVWLLLLAASSLYISVTLGPFALPDLLVVALIGPVLLMRSVQPSGRALGRLAGHLIPSVWAWTVVMIVASMRAETTSAALVQTTKNLAGLAFFVVALKLALHVGAVNLRRWAAPVLVVLLGVLAASMLAAGVEGRAAGTFPNPIYAATWAGAALILIATMRAIPSLLVAAAALTGLAGMYMANSFAAYIGLVVTGAYLLTRGSGKLWLWHVGLSALIAAILVPDLMSGAPGWIDPQGRSQASSSSRLDIWSEAWGVWMADLWGIGPGQFSSESYVPMGNRGIGYETHNDYLGSLVELGLIGLLATIAIYWIIASAGGVRTRALVIFVAVVATFHNVINFRHFWVFLAVTLALDLLDRNEPSSQSRGAGSARALTTKEPS